MKSVIKRDINRTIRVGYSGKALGNTVFSFGPDADNNFAKFTAEFAGKTVYVMPAVGGVAIIDIDKASEHQLDNTNYDGAITRDRQALLVVKSADCIPLVLYGKDPDYIALAHVGTTGASSHLPAKLVAVIKQPPEKILCYIGPSISQKSYRFDNETLNSKKLDASWEKYTIKQSDGYHLDLLGYVLDELKNAGIQPENIELENVDTGSDQNYFSHRRHKLTGEPDGRNCFAACLI